MEQIFLSILVFTGLVLILVSILNFAESNLLPQGDIRININGENDWQKQKKAYSPEEEGCGHVSEARN